MADELERGNLSGFESARRAYEDLASELRLPSHVESAQVRRAARELLKGRLREAAAMCDRGLAEGGSGYAFLLWVLARFSICRERDTVMEVEPFVRAIAGAASAWPAMRYWLVNTLASAGSADAPLEFNAIAANHFSDVPGDLSRLMVLGFCAEACTIVGSADSARFLYPHLLPFADRHMLARLAAQVKQWDSADEHFAEALRQAQALTAGPRTAHIQYNWATMLIQRGRTDDVARARSLLESAASAARLFELSGLFRKSKLV
jgi:hypothetical protein